MKRAVNHVLLDCGPSGATSFPVMQLTSGVYSRGPPFCAADAPLFTGAGAGGHSRVGSAAQNSWGWRFGSGA